MEEAFSVEPWQHPQSEEWVRAALDAIEDEHNKGIIRECPQAHAGIGSQINPAHSHPNGTGKVSPPGSQIVLEAIQAAAPVIFFSYATPNRRLAEEAFSWFKSEGLPVWFAPWNGRPGSFYHAEIGEALSRIKVLLLFLSKDAAKSENVYREVVDAIELEKIIIPFKIE